MFILIWPANLPAYVYVAEYMVLDYIQTVFNFTNGPALDRAEPDVVVVGRQSLQPQPRAFYGLTGGMFEIRVHLYVDLNAKSAPLVLNHLRPKRKLLFFTRVPEFPQNVHTSEEHLRFAHPESEVAVEAMDRSAII